MNKITETEKEFTINIKARLDNLNYDKVTL